MPSWGWYRPLTPLGTESPALYPSAYLAHPCGGALVLLALSSGWKASPKLCRASGLAGWCYAVGGA